MILGTVLLVLLIGGGAIGLWKYRATLADDDDARERRQLTDEMLVALAKEHDRRERASSGPEPDRDRLAER